MGGGGGLGWRRRGSCARARSRPFATQPGRPPAGRAVPQRSCRWRDARGNLRGAPRAARAAAHAGARSSSRPAPGWGPAGLVRPGMPGGSAQSGAGGAARRLREPTAARDAVGPGRARRGLGAAAAGAAARRRRAGRTRAAGRAAAAGDGRRGAAGHGAADPASGAACGRASVLRRRARFGTAAVGRSSGLRPGRGCGARDRQRAEWGDAAPGDPARRRRAGAARAALTAPVVPPWRDRSHLEPALSGVRRAALRATRGAARARPAGDPASTRRRRAAA